MIRPKLQIDISPQARDYLKALAYSRGQTLTEYILIAAAEAGDAKAKKLIEESMKLKHHKSVSKQIHK
jgi:hypothetical protein